jgi:hypothetical protein
MVERRCRYCDRSSNPPSFTPVNRSAAGRSASGVDALKPTALRSLLIRNTVRSVRIAAGSGGSSHPDYWRAGYVANILRQLQSPRRPQPPLALRDPLLNELVTDPFSLLEYDAFILKPGKEPDDTPPTEAKPIEPVHHEPPTGDDSN